MTCSRSTFMTWRFRGSFYLYLLVYIALRHKNCNVFFFLFYAIKFINTLVVTYSSVCVRIKKLHEYVVVLWYVWYMQRVCIVKLFKQYILSEYSKRTKWKYNTDSYRRNVYVALRVYEGLRFTKQHVEV